MLGVVNVDLDVPGQVWAETCPELFGRIFNITDANFVEGMRKTKILKPRAFLTENGVRIPALETAMNRELQKRPISRRRVYKSDHLSWAGAELIFDVPGRLFEPDVGGQ